MNRRAIVIAAGLLVVSAGRALSQAPKLRRVAFALPGSQAGFQPQLDAFRAALEDLGHVEGRDVSIDVRWNENRTDQLATFAAEVVRLKPEVIVTATSAGVAAFKKATSSIPVIFATAAEPVEQGFVHSLQRPGGNITGVVVYADLTEKLVEIAREALPKARRIALLVNESDPAHRFMLPGFEPTAQRLKFEPVFARVKQLDDIDVVLARLAERQIDAVIVPQLALFTSNRARLAGVALKLRLPLIANNPLFAESGALLTYGVPIDENYRRAAALVDKVLRGATPAELPVEQPHRFLLVVNRKTANTIGVTLSPLTILRADRLID